MLKQRRILKITDILGEVEYLVVPEPDWSEWDKMPDDDHYWFCHDNALGNPDDFCNPELYQSVELIIESEVK